MDHTVQSPGQPDRVYHGIGHIYCSHKDRPDFIAIAWLDGEPDLWCVEGPGAIPVLNKYYIDSYGRAPYRVDIYKK